MNEKKTVNPCKKYFDPRNPRNPRKSSTHVLTQPMDARNQRYHAIQVI